MPIMKISQRIIRGIFFSIPLLGAVVLACFQSEKNLAPLYFASKPEYQLFLEDLGKSGQAKADAEKIFSWSRANHDWYLVAAATLSDVLADRIDPLYWTPQRIQDLSQYIVLMSYRYQVSPAFVLAVIEVESQFRADAVSPKGAVGLMQLKPETAKSVTRRWKGHKGLRDPKTNIEYGLAYLQELREQFRDPNIVMAAYNIGPTATLKKIKAGERIPTSYAEKIRKGMLNYPMPKSFPRRTGTKIWL